MPPSLYRTKVLSLHKEQCGIVKLVSWNVNGIRAVVRNGFQDWLANADADIVCLQETKLASDELVSTVLATDGYTLFWQPAKRPGYSGVATLTRKKPIQVAVMGIPEFDDEGRVQILEFETFTLINAYFPNTRRDHSRLDYKLRFCQAMEACCSDLRAQGKQVILCGDYNIAHESIDLARPKQNENNAGFLPEERAAMTRFLGTGYVDVFRHFNPEPGHYTWWAYFANARAKNIGWRIDYFCVNQEFLPCVQEAAILSEVAGSDHCPITLSIH